MSEIIWLYLLTFGFTVYDAFKAASEIGNGVTTVFIGSLIGVVFGALFFMVLCFTDRIWKIASQNQEKSLWAIIGVSYFIFCGLCAPLFAGIFIDKLVTNLLS